MFWIMTDMPKACFFIFYFLGVLKNLVLTYMFIITCSTIIAQPSSMEEHLCLKVSLNAIAIYDKKYY